MAKLVTPPAKFLHPEWVISNQSQFANAEGERTAAELLVEESKRMCDDTEKRTQATQRDVDKKLDQRLNDIRNWQAEVDGKLADIKTEIDTLDAFRTRLERALEACAEPLQIAQQCLLRRQARRGIDLVHDDPEKELLKEVEVIQGAVALLERTREQAVEQLRLNRKAKYNLEKDLTDKFSALQIDEHNAELRNYSAPGSTAVAAKIDANSSTPDDWEAFSNANILAAEKQRNNSVALRTLIDGALQQIANDMKRQKEIVDIALTKRIDETRDTKEKLEGHLSKVLAQIKDMEDNMARLAGAAQDKQAPMRLAETRLENRSKRPNVELCRDHVQYRLVEEVEEINESVASLHERYAQSEESLKGLIRRQLELEEDIGVKADSLYIDDTECMGMRKSINIQAY